MQNIAIVSSTVFGGGSRKCFEAGLASSLSGQAQPRPPELFESEGAYDLTTLRKLIRFAADRDPRPDLIITVGGLVTAQAAACELQQQDPKFVFLSGDALVGNPAALAGGVNMNFPSGDDARKTLLKSQYPSVQDESMYLVVNGNDPMWPSEAKYWPSSKVVRFFHGTPNPPQNTQSADESNHFIAEFRNLAERDPTPTGLVISADPYFIYFRAALAIALADRLPVPVCYLFREFIDASAKTHNKDKSISLNKPPLNNPNDESDESTAYFQLGKQVGRFLTGTANVGVVTWDGSTWVLKSEVHEKPPSGEAQGMEIEVRVKGRVDEAGLREVLATFRGKQ
jgi:hypothetical protein